MTFFSKASEALFLLFLASEALYGKTYLLEVVTIFDKDHFSLMTFFFWGPFLFFVVFGLQRPFLEKLIFSSFWRPFLFFAFFLASEAHYGKTYLLRVVTTFNKDHFALYDFWGALLFFSGFYDFRQGSFLILWLFLSEASEALFCFLLFSGFRGPLRKNLFTQGGNDFRQGSFFIIWLFLSEASEALLFFSGFRGPFSTNLFTPGGNDFRQGSFFILCFFLSAEEKFVESLYKSSQPKSVQPAPKEGLGPTEVGLKTAETLVYCLLM